VPTTASPPNAGRALWAWLALVPALYFLFFFNLSGVGLIGPDEPRYAAIGREMARSGDWVTPRLWGQAWFEKPPLLYWMTGLACRAGLGEEMAPRLPVALLSVAFLWFYWRRLEREFGRRAALFATAVLATSAAWLAFSHVAVTDLPMAAAFSAAMLAGLPWIARGDRRSLALAGALLGAAVLAKGLVPLVLALPLVWAGRRQWRDLLRPVPILAFVAVAAPWYLLVSLRHGSSFLGDFFLKQHLARFFTGELQHQQPFWFYIPVLAAGLFPWTPLLALLSRKQLSQDARLRFLLVWVAFGLLFFSASTNKLPGYLLPLIPAACALMGVALAEAKTAKWALAASAALLVLVPVVAGILPEALLRGLSRAQAAGLPWQALLAVAAVAAVAWAAERAGRRLVAVGAIAAAMLAGVLWMEATTFPVLDRTVSARGVWSQVAGRASEVCVGQVSRSWRYNLNYYSGSPLPECGEARRAIQIQPGPGDVPRAEFTAAGAR
jgi:4-amino-4-deoxy-L-arabinose transferase-like glycosyltransferase